MIILVMGVSGAGKTAVGEQLARVLGCEFLDADDFHPAANVEKMRSGVPLTDADRWPWLALINERLRVLQAQGGSAVLACSALKHAYRERLAHGVRDLRVVFLRGSCELIQQRLAARKHRYMPPSLLKSQFETLEIPAQAIAIDIEATIEDIVARVVQALAEPNGAANMETVKIKVEGMTCQGCVRSVTNVLTRQPGVTSAQVSLENAAAEVSFDPSKINAADLSAAIEAAGYHAST